MESNEFIWMDSFVMDCMLEIKQSFKVLILVVKVEMFID